MHHNPANTDVPPLAFRFIALLAFHGATFTLLLVWSAVPNAVESFFFSYRFLYAFLYIYGLWMIHSIGWKNWPKLFSRVTFWFLLIASLCLVFDSFYLGYHMIYRTLVSCTGPLSAAICGDHDATIRYIVSTAAVSFIVLLELFLVGVSFYWRQYPSYSNSNRSTLKHLH